MKLSSSTGDFAFYLGSIDKMAECFGQTKFKYVNLEQCGAVPELFSENEDDVKRLADACGNAAARAGISYVISHAPCLHNAVLSAINNPSDEQYTANVRAIRRSIEVCHLLGIPNIVVHACTEKSFTREDFYKYNRMFYQSLFPTAERYGITMLTENWDNDGTHFSTGRAMRDFIDYMGHPLLSACWDTAHGNLAKSAREQGQYRNIVDLGDKLKGLHISDNFGLFHHHSWPFSGYINFDEVMQGLIDVGYDGYFNFEASYTLIHHKKFPRKSWEYNGKEVTTLLDPPLDLKLKAVDLLYDIGQHILESYGCFEP